MTNSEFSDLIDSARDLQKYLFKNDYLLGFVAAKKDSNKLYVFTYNPWFGEIIAYWHGFSVEWSNKV